MTWLHGPLGAGCGWLVDLVDPPLPPTEACQALLTCTADRQPDRLALVEEAYGEGSPCWDDAREALACDAECEADLAANPSCTVDERDIDWVLETLGEDWSVAELLSGGECPLFVCPGALVRVVPLSDGTFWLELATEQIYDCTLATDLTFDCTQGSPWLASGSFHVDEEELVLRLRDDNGNVVSVLAEPD